MLVATTASNARRGVSIKDRFEADDRSLHYSTVRTVALGLVPILNKPIYFLSQRRAMIAIVW